MNKPHPLFLPPVFMTLAILLMLGLDRWLPGAEVVAWEWRWWGALPAAVGLSLSAWGAAMLILHHTALMPFHEATKLITSGAFRLSRNPIYLGLTITLVAIAWGLGTATPWLVPPAFALFIDRYFIRPDEAMLARLFGDTYQAYARRTRRWL
ncbi:MAG TPA: isoprenylcysteine carboxylmethyltransferase family protein [Thermoanaerobaculia bacterium]|nr:isoprenylcysteine carboxylmethyltransferase family protein [Thermoanaerobaculia bacterium]